jgi:hypothetical protein
MDFFIDGSFTTNTNILEDALDRVMAVPIETRRSLALLRELDAKCMIDLERLKQLQDRHIELASKKQKDEALELDITQTKQRFDQKMEEKVSLATQLWEVLDRHVARLKKDATALESMLKESGDLDAWFDNSDSESNTTSYVGGNNITTTNSIMNDVMYVNPNNNNNNSNSNLMMMSTGNMTGLPYNNNNNPPPNMMMMMTMNNNNPIQVGGGLTATTMAVTQPIQIPNSLVAACTRQPLYPGSDETQDLWILARIINLKADKFVVADIEDEAKRYTLSRSSIVGLPPQNEDVAMARERLNHRNMRVLAIYPDTTTFYFATLAIFPFKAGSASDAPVDFYGKVVCAVQFADDEDESGVNPKRYVLCCHVVER